MAEKEITFKILRFKPGIIDPPRHQTYRLLFHPAMTVLEGLEEIRLSQDESLMYRHCCHHASCGTCACMINGKPALACTTRIADLKSDLITLAPLENHPCIGDLAVDAAVFFRDFDDRWAHRRPIKKESEERTPPGVKQLLRFDNCIECGCCVAACPVMSAEPRFMGPAALAALNNEKKLHPAGKALLLEVAAGPNGAGLCNRHLECSRVCPAAVYPARHIADLQREIEKRK